VWWPSFTAELPCTYVGRTEAAAAQVLVKLIMFSQEEMLHTGRITMEVVPPARY